MGISKDYPMTNYKFKKYLKKHPKIISIPLTECIIKIMTQSQDRNQESKS